LEIANTMIMSILERTREIGIMKAIGRGRSREIKLIFFFEAAVIGLNRRSIWGAGGPGQSMRWRIVWLIRFNF